MRFSYRDVAPADRPMLAEWLAVPDVHRWYGGHTGPAELIAAIDLPNIKPMIVECEGRPVAYLQRYDVHGWPDHPYAFLPKGALGLDTFIGASADMGRGLGPEYLSDYAARLFAGGVPAICVDPDPQNLRAIAAYAKVGFQHNRIQDTQWGPAALMVLWPPAGEASS